MQWFKYDTITAMLTFAGLVTVCIGKYHAIYLLKNQCLKEGVAGCHDTMLNKRYPYQDIYSYIVLALNIPSVITYWKGHRYRQIWINIQLGAKKINTNIPLTAGITWGFFVQIVLLLIVPIPGYDVIYETTGPS